MRGAWRAPRRGAARLPYHLYFSQRYCEAHVGAHVPVLCLDDSYHEWMYEPPHREQPTHLVPPAGRGGRRAWKNWESAKCIDWVHFLDKLQAMQNK